MLRTSFGFLGGVILSLVAIVCVAQNQFTNTKQIAAGYSITPILGDYDGDGDMDILGTGMYVKDLLATNTTVLLRNDGAGQFVEVTIQLPTFYFGGMYQWADLDNDNDLDIIAGGCSYYCYNTKMISIYRNDGADTFTLISNPTNLIGGKTFSLADYNNDGLIDIEIATQSDNDDSVIGHTFYQNTGQFVFQKTFQLPVTVGEVAWGDLDKDGWTDFVLYDHEYKNLHDGTFQIFPSSPAMQLNIRHFLFDADGDGDLDVVTNTGILMKNDGTGILSFGPVIIPYDYINSIVVADFDGDGKRDMIASGGTLSQPKTQLFRSNGNTTFVAENINTNYPYSYNLAVADMDNDQDPDVIISGVFLSNLILLENGLATKVFKPSVPATLHSSSDATSLSFSWDAATDPQQSDLNYNMYLMYGGDFKIAPSADLTTGAGFIPGAANGSSSLQRKVPIAGLPDGYYQWSIQSVNAELNSSAFATPNEFTLYKNNPANAPTGLALSAVTDHDVSLNWTDNSSDETSFTLERSSIDGNTGFAQIQQLPANTVSFTDNTVSSRSVYYYRIRLDGSATVAYSNVIQVKTKPAISTAPSNVSVAALTSTSAKIQWEYTASGITGFVIERSADNANHFAAVGSVNADQLTYTDLQLESGREYYYRVFAVNATGTSDYSSAVSVFMPLKEFNKITLASLTYEYRYIMGGIAWGDYDNDGNDDLFLAYKAQLFHNLGNGTFEKITTTGINYSDANTFVAVWGDYDNDGFLDMFYYNDQVKSSLYRGHGDGTFTKVTCIISSDFSELRNASWTDYDLDGDLDLSMTGGRYIYRNDGNDVFVRVDLPGTAANYYSSSVASWADYDDDGDPDVFWGNYGNDEFFKNNGDGTFTSITDQRITKDYNFDCCPIATPTALWTDFNNDLKLDLTVFHAAEPIYAYANHANKFDSVFYSYDYSREAWKNMFWTDYDNDGDLDLFAMGQYNIKTDIWENREGNSLHQLKGGVLYDYVSSDANFSWNDYDNDGYSDLFQFDGDKIVYKNPSNGNNWIKIRLKGRSSNSTGLGAKVFVKSNSNWQREDVTTHHSDKVQEGFMSLFGLGKATLVDSIKILWPSGNRQYLSHVNVNQMLLIDEANAQVKVTQPPSNLLASEIYPATVLLNWTDRSNDEQGFVIEMMADAGPFTQVGTVAANTTSFQMTGLSIGIKYKFRVRTSPANGRYTNTAEAQIRLFTEVFAGDLTTFQSNPAGMAWGDPDNDGDPDLFVGSESSESDAIYYNDKGIFTRSYLRTGSDYSRQAQWIDYNNDGYQDLHISVGGGIIASQDVLNDYVYKNNGVGQLVEQTGHILSQDGYPDYLAAWGDLNNDGYLDMVTPRPSALPSVFLNIADNLTPQQGASGLKPQPNMILLSDFDNDRDLDVISASYYTGLSVFKNNNGQFNAATISGQPASVISYLHEDFNNDGINDVLIIDQNQTLRLFLYDSSAQILTEKPNVFPSVSPVTKLSAGDFDNNGYLDVFVMGKVDFYSNTNLILLNFGNLKFTSLADPILTRTLNGIALADFNKDGHLDLVTLSTGSNYNTSRYLLKGTINDNHWLRVKLKGKVNKFGIGARIRLFTGDGSQVREIRSGASWTFSDEQVAHFGLGTLTAINYLKVEWPSGVDQWIAYPAVDREMIVEEENTTPPPSPAAPSNLVVSLRYPVHIDLNWSNNSTLTKMFRIERAIGSSAFKFFKNVSSNTTSYVDSSFVNYKVDPFEVKYRVIAISEYSQKSPPSNVASVFVITGIEEGNINSLVIYPQPASSKVFIRSNQWIQRITIFGGQGEVIKEMPSQQSGEVEVTLSGFAPGIYFVRVTDEKGTYTKKLLVIPEQ